MRTSFRKHPYAGLFALALAIRGFASPELAVAADRQTRTVGPQPNGSIVASSNQLMTPIGTIVQLGSPVRAKAVAINPNTKTKTGAVLLMDTAQPIIVFNTETGEVIQRYIPVINNGSSDPSNGQYGSDITYGSYNGIAYSADGSRLFFSQDYGNDVAVVDVDPASGHLSSASLIPVPPPPSSFPLSGGAPLYTPGVANPGSIAVADSSTALVALNANNTLGVIDLGAGKVLKSIPVGNAPNSVVVGPKYAYVSNEGGRPATAKDFTNLSDGTPIVADKFDAWATTGTVSVVDLSKGTVVKTIDIGLHPAGMAISNGKLYVANTYSDSISVIDLGTNTVTRTISVGVPVPGGTFGAGPNAIAIHDNIAYVTLGQSNAVAVISLSDTGPSPVKGYIPTLYFPTSIVYDDARHQLVVSDDKGLGAQGSIGSAHGVEGFNTHQDTGVVNLIPIPSAVDLRAMTQQVISNNAWDSPSVAAATAATPNPNARPVAIPRVRGEPSLIKHVFLIIKENRTYDQILGDLPQGNGDPNLAIFASGTPNQHALVRRFPLLDNVYAPSRQSADGHPWIVESGSFYSNDILSPDWIRSYPGGNSNDALTYTPKGFLWSQMVKQGLNVRMYGEWSAGYVISTEPKCTGSGNTCTWADFYNTHLYIESGGTQGSNIVPFTADSESTAVPSAAEILDPHYPSFNLGIPDQYRMDYYLPIFQNQATNGTVPALTIIWLPNDHTNGVGPSYPLPINYQADNDLALGRLAEAISHSNVWSSTAIFVEEDDAQDGVDHVDGHRQPVYVISPYAVPPQSPGVGQVIHTTYTAENINRPIENILGLQPLTQFDLVASPMFDVFTNTPDTAPWTHVSETVALNVGSSGPLAGTGSASYAVKQTPMMQAWTWP